MSMDRRRCMTKADRHSPARSRSGNAIRDDCRNRSGPMFGFLPILDKGPLPTGRINFIVPIAEIAPNIVSSVDVRYNGEDKRYKEKKNCET